MADFSTTFQAQMQALHIRLDAMRQDMEHEGFSYAGLDDRREDRAEYREVQDLARLQDRLDEMAQERPQVRSREEGMQY